MTTSIVYIYIDSDVNNVDCWQCKAIFDKFNDLSYRIYSRISCKINDKITPQKLGAAYRPVYTSTPPRSLTPAVLECYNCSLKSEDDGLT